MIIFDKYITQLLEPGASKKICVLYNDSPDATHRNVIVIFKSEFDRNDQYMPKSFNITINFDDIDGNEMFQVFDLACLDGDYYYSLKRTETVATSSYKV